MFFFSSRRRHTRLQGDWSSDVCSSDLSKTRKWLFSKPFLLGFHQARISGAFKDDDALEDAIRLFFLHEIGRASCRERATRRSVENRLRKKYRTRTTLCKTINNMRQGAG